MVGGWGWERGKLNVTFASGFIFYKCHKLTLVLFFRIYLCNFAKNSTRSTDCAGRRSEREEFSVHQWQFGHHSEHWCKYKNPLPVPLCHPLYLYCFCVSSRRNWHETANVSLFLIPSVIFYLESRTTQSTTLNSIFNRIAFVSTCVFVWKPKASASAEK